MNASKIYRKLTQLEDPTVEELLNERSSWQIWKRDPHTIELLAELRKKLEEAYDSSIRATRNINTSDAEVRASILMVWALEEVFNIINTKTGDE